MSALHEYCVRQWRKPSNRCSRALIQSRLNRPIRRLCLLNLPAKNKNDWAGCFLPLWSRCCFCCRRRLFPPIFFYRRLWLFIAGIPTYFLTEKRRSAVRRPTHTLGKSSWMFYLSWWDDGYRTSSNLSGQPGEFFFPWSSFNSSGRGIFYVPFYAETRRSNIYIV